MYYNPHITGRLGFHPLYAQETTRIDQLLEDQLIPPYKTPINGVYTVYSYIPLLHLGWSVYPLNIWKIVWKSWVNSTPPTHTPQIFNIPTPTPNLAFLLLRPPRQHMPPPLAEERWRTITISSFGIDSFLTNSMVGGFFFHPDCSKKIS